MPAHWIEEMNSSNSRKHKEKTIEKAVASGKLGDKSAIIFLTCSWYAYNPFNTYNIKRIPETTGLENRQNPWDEFFSLAVDFAERSITGNAALEAVEVMSQRFDSFQWNNLARNVLLKDLRVGATIKTFNKFLESKIPVFDCQLATDSAKHQKKLVGKKILQRKLDGVRAITIVENGQAFMYSRNGKPFLNFHHIENQLSNIAHHVSKRLGFLNKFVIDGEVMSEDFQKLMKQAHRKYDAEAGDSVYHIFDIMPWNSFVDGKCNTAQFQRTADIELVRSLFEPLQNVEIEPFLTVDLDTSEGKDIMHRYADDCVADGYEGIMIKDMSAPYQCKRTTHWLKWKPSITVDLTVIDLEEGTGRNKGRLGALVCEGVDDSRKIHVNVGSGLSDSDRDELWESDKDSVIGQVVEVKADVVTQNQDGTYSLRFPRFVRFRGFEPGEKL
jgi:DNA ligase-1